MKHPAIQQFVRGTLGTLVNAMCARPKEYEHSIFANCAEPQEMKHSTMQQFVGGTRGTLHHAMCTRPRGYELSIFANCVES